MWTRIKLTNADTLPPLHEPVMLYAEDSRYRSWMTFHTEEHRLSTLLKSEFSHWRVETVADTP